MCHEIGIGVTSIKVASLHSLKGRESSFSPFKYIKSSIIGLVDIKYLSLNTLNFILRCSSIKCSMISSLKYIYLSTYVSKLKVQI